MKKILFLIIFISLSQISFAQGIDVKDSSEVTESVVDIPLSFGSKSENSKATQSSKGGSKFYDYINNNYHLPNVPGLKGKVVVSFVINEDGSIGDFKIVENLGYGTAEELIRVLKSAGNKWKPGMKDGKPVKITFSLPLDIVVPNE